MISGKFSPGRNFEKILFNNRDNREGDAENDFREKRDD